MTIKRWPNKDPADVLDYGIDRWARHLEFVSGEVLAEASWSVVPEGLTLGASAIEGDRTAVWLSGGDPGRSYVVSCRVETSLGRTAERSARIYVTER